MSFFAIPGPGGIPYGIGEGAWLDDVVAARLVAGTGGSAGTGGWGWVEAGAGSAVLGSGSGLGKMCFSRLFL